MGLTTKSKLPRLPREFYQGRAVILWTHTIEHRMTGWLDDAFHANFREVLVHTCHRFALATPVYVLMPDHWHIMWMGVSGHSDQWLATAFLRKHLGPTLRASLQDRAHDHVLRESERARGAFPAACQYVLENPERGGCCSDWRHWPYVGSIVPGYPDLDPRSPTFWDQFWKIHSKLVDAVGLPALTRRATQSVRGPLREQRDGGPSSRSPLREERDAPP